MLEEEDASLASIVYDKVLIVFFILRHFIVCCSGVVLRETTRERGEGGESGAEQENVSWKSLKGADIFVGMRPRGGGGEALETGPDSFVRYRSDIAESPVHRSVSLSLPCA